MSGDISQPNTTETNIAAEASWDLRPELIGIIIIGLFLLLAVIIIAANLLVIVSVYANERLRCPTYFLILSLSVADLLVGMILLPARVIELLYCDWTKEFVWCQITLSLNLFSLSASLLNLLALTVDRFLAISYSLKYNIMITNSRTLVEITAVWFTAFIVSFSPLFGVGMRSLEVSRTNHKLCHYGDFMEEEYMALFFFLICATPTALITVAYFKIFVLARNQERRIASLQVFANGDSAKINKRVSSTRDSKAAKTIAIVIGLFYFCWSPFFAGILLAIFRKEATSYVFVAIATFVVYSNSAINPLVYGYLNEEFKHTYKRLFRSCRPSILKKNTHVALITITAKNFEKRTITAAIPVTPLEMEAQNTHPVFSFQVTDT